MDLWEALGVSRQAVLVAAVVGVVAAVLYAVFAWRRGDKDERVQVDLNSHR